MIHDNKTLTSYVDQFGKLVQPDEMPSYTLLKYPDSGLFYGFSAVTQSQSEWHGRTVTSTDDDIRSQIDAVTNNMMSVEKTGLQNQIGRANEAIRTQQIELIFSSIGAFMVSLVVGRHISQYSIIKPLSTLKDAASQIASGNLDFEMKAIPSLTK